MSSHSIPAPTEPGASASEFSLNVNSTLEHAADPDAFSRAIGPKKPIGQLLAEIGAQPAEVGMDVCEVGWSQWAALGDATAGAAAPVIEVLEVLDPASDKAKKAGA